MKRLIIIAILVVIALVIGICALTHFYGRRLVEDSFETLDLMIDLDHQSPKNLGIALLMYSNDYAGAYPPDLETLLKGDYDYVHDPECLYDTVSGKQYHYISGLRDDDDPSTILAYDEDPNPDGKHSVLHVDGEVSYMDKAVLDEQLAREAKD